MYENDDGIIVKVSNDIFEMYDNGIIVKLLKSSVLQFVIMHAISLVKFL